MLILAKKKRIEIKNPTYVKFICFEDTKPSSYMQGALVFATGLTYSYMHLAATACLV